MIDFHNTKEIKKLAYTIIIGLIGGTVLLTFFVQNYKSDYKRLGKEDTLKIKVEKFSSYQGLTFIDTYDGTKIEIPNARNFSLDEVIFPDFVKVNDSIFKNEKSDSILIKRKGEKYHFIVLYFN
ncbi:hypothetical protein [Marivirga sp.]|uniref:hypothetical protein n=1 Tax=Marivirga sp. TaxID=2018662 RepID=UPI003DA762AC